MTDVHYKIVFDGELMPGATPETVKDNLAHLFRSDRARIEALFGGRTVVLKRDLGDEEADRYLEALQQAGARVRKEPDLAAGLSLVAAEDEPDTQARATMTCPKCGHEQVKAIQCAACGIVIEKYLTRQAQLAEGTPAGAPAASPYAPPRAEVGEILPEYGELKVFSFQGRIGRLRYLAWYMALVLVAMPASLLIGSAALLSPTLLIGLSAVAVIAFFMVTLFIGAQRLHDIGWSGWFQLLFLVPVVGGVLGLLMLIIPSTDGVNRYGPPPPPNSRGVTVLACTVILVPIIGILAAIAIPAYQGYVTRAHQAGVPTAPVSPAQE